MADGTLFSLDGKVALVTGGNGGIGLAMAHALAAHGASVAVWGTNPDKNAAAEKELAAHGTDVLSLRCDVSNEDEVEESVGLTIERFGQIDACFANAAIAPVPARATEFPTEEWRRVLGVDLDGVFFTLRAVARHMVERGGGGSLVVTASMAAFHGQPTRHPYAAAKGGVLAIMRSMAVELARHGIRANAVIPGWIETAAAETMLQDAKLHDAVVRRIPQRRIGSPEDLGGIAVYLASDASSYHTGDTITVDGGYAVF